MKENTCCFTGHRKIPLSSEIFIQNRLEKQIVKLINQDISYFMVGGALGFDTIAATTIIYLKKQYDIKLILALPCKGQTIRWRKTDREIYNLILNKADEVVYISEEYNRSCMFKRNRYLVDNSQVCLCYLTKEDGGTAYTVNYAQSKGLSIINIKS